MRVISLNVSPQMHCDDAERNAVLFVPNCWKIDVSYSRTPTRMLNMSFGYRPPNQVQYWMSGESRLSHEVHKYVVRQEQDIVSPVSGKNTKSIDRRIRRPGSSRPFPQYHAFQLLRHIQRSYGGFRHGRNVPINRYILLAKTYPRSRRLFFSLWVSSHVPFE